jgi:DNA-binding response OmpR family regulator
MSSKEKTSCLEAMDRNVQILLRLVNLLLDFRKVENKKIKLKIEQTSLSKLLAYYTDNFKILAEKKGINLSFEDTDSESIICIDNEKLESIINNLLSNALKYTPNNKSIKVKLHNGGEIALPKSASNKFHDSDFICFSVQDTGIGIPYDKIDFIFERFNQITSNSITEIGTGIGLAVAKYLTEAHKGFISVESTLGEGSTFFVWLPATKKFYTNDEIHEDSSAEFSPSDFIAKQSFISSKIGEPLPEQNDSIVKIKEQTILIVEDHPEMRAYIKDSLIQKYNIIEAENGKDGLEKALVDGPDLVITDVMMPVMDGMEFCKKLKKNMNISHIPVVMLTAKNSLENELKGLDNGADQYLVKPFNIEHLLLVVRNLLESRKKMQLKFSGTNLPEPKEITVTSADEKFFMKTNEIIEKHIANSDFNVELLSQQTGLSTVHLYRKLKSITGMSTNEYIRSFKMKRAAQLLRQNKLRISEVAYSIGYNDPKYFRKCFKNEFGKSPSDYAKDEKLDEEISNS